MKKLRTYNYKKITINFDLDYEKDKEMVDWMEKHLAKKVNFNTLMKNGLKLLMAEEIKKVEEKEAG